MSLDVDYCRKSQDRAGTAEGVDTQHQENADFTAEMGRTLARTYCDNDVSAFSGVERPEYERMLADMEAGKIRSVTIWHANRLHRTIAEVPRFIRVARANKVKLYSTTKGEAYNLERASGRKQLRDDTSEAEYESEHRGERVTVARKRQARNGDYGGGVRPYGWGVDTGRVRSVCVNPKAPTMDRVYEDRPVLDMGRHNEEETAEIRRWAADLLAGVLMAHVLQDLAARNVLTVSQKDGRTLKRRGKVIQTKGWDGSTVKGILTHPRTSGHAVYNGEIVKRNAYPAIIPEDTRQALIALFNDPSRPPYYGNTPKWLGSLIIPCPKCPETVQVGKNSRGKPVYRCHKSHCAMPARLVDQAIEDVVIARLSQPDLADLFTTDPEVDVTALRQELVAIDTRKRQAARMFATTAIDGDMLRDIKDEADQRMREIRADLDAATTHSPIAEFAATDNPRRTWNELSVGRQREIVRHMLSIKLHPPGQGRRTTRDHIEITARTLTPAAA